MALTLQVEQRLQALSLIKLFEDRKPEWLASAQGSYDFVKENFPEDATVRRDDVAKALKPIIEVNVVLKTYLAQRKATQKYWITDFTDLIIDRVWNTITQVKP